MAEEKKPITYKDSGVDIEAGEHAVDLIKEITRSTFSKHVISDIGGFGGLFSIKGLGGDDPVLVSGTDGVGTKLRIAFMTGKHDTIGIDAVAMCANDVICTGAKPLFFLDYLAAAKLEPEKIKDIITGIGEGCRQAGCALIGGEMAEMPGFYAEGEYDIAGFCVGIVDRSKIIDGTKIRQGDILIGLPSSGMHSNGFSLARKALFDVGGLNINDKIQELGGKNTEFAGTIQEHNGKIEESDDTIEELGGKTVAEVLLEPTLIYARQIAEAVEAGIVRGISHITGGGLEGNTLRVIPKDRKLEINWSSWERPAIFTFIQKIGGIEEEEMRRVFNCGIGMVLITSPEDSAQALKLLQKNSGKALVIGEVK